MKQRTLVLAGLGIAIAISGLAAAAPALPDEVNKTFKARFPQAQITHVATDVEDGVTVTHIEFTESRVEKTTDIAADGTMLETAAFIPEREVPEAVMKSILKEAAGATLGEIDRVDITHETRDGHVYKLPATVIQYEVQLTKSGSTGEVVVGSDGSVIEAAKWDKK